MNMRDCIIGVSIAGTLMFATGLGWYTLREEMRARDRTSQEIFVRLDQRNEGFTLLSQKMGASTRALAGLRADLGRMLERLSARLRELPPSTVVSEEPESAEEGEEVEEDMENLPRLPKGVAARFLLSNFRKDGGMSEIINNPALNPQGKKPDKIEQVKILRELIQANAQIDILRADVQVGVAEARSVLAGEGEFIDYAPGEKYMTEHDAITLGEKTEDGNTRMYYMRAEEFPEIHEKRAEQRRVADRALRKVVSILQ